MLAPPATFFDLSSAAPAAPRQRSLAWRHGGRTMTCITTILTRLQKVVDVCERALAQNPRHPEAMVWHGAAAIVRAAQAFRKGDAAAGQPLFERGVTEMTAAVAIAPDNPGVLIPRGAVLFEATRSLPPGSARPMLESAIANYERALEVQGPTFAALGDHAQGELLFGLAEGWSRAGGARRAR